MTDSSLSDNAAAAVDKAADAATDVSDKAAAAADSASSGAAKAADTVKAETTKAADSVKAETPKAADTVTATTTKAPDTVKAGTAKAADTVKTGTTKATDTVKAETAKAADAATDATDGQAAPPPPPRTMDEIEADLEATRERLAGRLDDLQEYVSPRNVAQRQLDKVKGVFVDEYGGIKPDRVLIAVGAVVAVVGLGVVLRRRRR